MSVVCDLDGKCLRGSTDYDGQVVHVGNGIAKLNRQDLFGSNPSTRYVHKKRYKLSFLYYQQLR